MSGSNKARNLKKILKDLEFAYDICERDLVAFRKIFLDYDESDEVDPPFYHKVWSNILLNGETHFAIEAFRESGKSQIVLRAFLLHCLAFPTTKRDYVILIKNNQTLAENKLVEIEEEYLSNPLLSSNLVSIVKKSGQFFTVRVKDRLGAVHLVRIEAYGKGASIRGLTYIHRRPKICIIDDPQDLEDMLSESTLEKDWKWFLSDVMFLGKRTRIFLIGNNLGEKCIIERVFENADELKFKTAKVKILDDKGKPTWEAKYPLHYINEEKEAYRKTGQLDVWYRERMCEVISPERQVFKREYFKYYRPEDFKWWQNRRNLNIYTTVDLAISEKETADYTAIVTVAVTPENHWFVLDIDYGRYDPSQTMDAIFRAVEKYRPLKVGIEKVAYQRALIHFLNKEMVNRNQFFIIEPLIADKHKEVRIKALQPRFKSGRIWFPLDADFLSELEHELLTFPNGKHDDLVDALAYMEQIAQVPVGTGEVTLGNGIYSLSDELPSVSAW